MCNYCAPFQGGVHPVHTESILAAAHISLDGGAPGWTSVGEDAGLVVHRHYGSLCGGSVHGCVCMCCVCLRACVLWLLSYILIVHGKRIKWYHHAHSARFLARKSCLLCHACCARPAYKVSWQILEICLSLCVHACRSCRDRGGDVPIQCKQHCVHGSPTASGAWNGLDLANTHTDFGSIIMNIYIRTIEWWCTVYSNCWKVPGI